MSRSRKKPIVKDRPRNHKKSTFYWRTIRRVIKQKVDGLVKNPEEDNLPDPKEIINDYDYCDYVTDYRDPHWDNAKTESAKKYIEKIKRK